jgi:hypothetical protein
LSKVADLSTSEFSNTVLFTPTQSPRDVAIFASRNPTYFGSASKINESIPIGEDLSSGATITFKSQTVSE